MKQFSILCATLVTLMGPVFSGQWALAQTTAPMSTPTDPAPASAAAVSGTTTAAAPAAIKGPQQAHYQLELMYLSYDFNQPTVKSSGALAGFALGGEYDLLQSSQMILWGIDYYTGTPTNDTVGGKPVLGSNAPTASSATADTDFYTFSAAWGTRQRLGESSLTLQESLGGAYRYFESKARGGKSPQQEQIFAYLPLGLDLSWRASDKWQWRVGAEEDFMVSGSSRTHMENVNPSMPTLKMTENSGTGTKVSFGARKKGEELDVVGEIFYRNWQISDSSTQAYVDNKGNERIGMTAANTTEMVGLGVGVTY